MTLLAPVLALALAAGGPATPPSPAVRQRVEDLLGSIHGPVPGEVFRSIGPGAAQALSDVARSATAMPSRRIRALEALASLGGAQAEAVHRDVAASAAPSAVRRGAIRGLGQLAGPAAPEALTPYLEQDPDPAVRASAAEALAGAAPAAGCARIRAHAGTEPDRGRFERALAECDRAGEVDAPPAR